MIKINLKVQILMSTYNGEQYLREQLDSIINQNFKNFEIFIRDDGSTDDTIEILKEYETKYKFIKIFLQNNIGVVNSFFYLINNANMEFDYFAFADQDDYWEPFKLEKLINEFQFINKPCLVFSKVEIVDFKLKHIMFSKKPDVLETKNAIIQNVVIGASCIINKELVKICNSKEVNTSNIVMHDWWLYLIATCFGEVRYLNISTMKYRQHGNNSIGHYTSYLDRKKKQFNYMKNKKSRLKRYNQINQFYILFKDELNTSNSNIIFDFIQNINDFFGRTKIFFCKGYIIQGGKFNNCKFGIYFLLNLW